jgi:ubiquinone/menaquinone biosynthesis C-methylase UbiE
MQVRDNWWGAEEKGGFFGRHYVLGDNSKLGPFLSRRMSLEERTDREVKFVNSVLHLKPGDELLDCPCGYGRHAVALAKLGVRVTGVDLNDYHLALARKKATELAVGNHVVFLKADMRDLHLEPDRFDAAINMFTSIGFFPEGEELDFLRGLHRTLKPGGKLMIHLDYNYERRMKPNYRDERVSRHLRDGSKLLVTERVIRDEQRMVGKWEIIQRNNKQIYSRSYSLRLYSPDHLKSLLESCGFTNVVAKGDLDNPAAGFNSQSLETVVIAEK